MKIIIATIKSWNIENAKKFAEEYGAIHDISIITDKEQLNIDYLMKFEPDYIFFPHWSFMIPKNIYSRYECVVFHMTDLPFGRGGSPLQNLIVRGFDKTVISAIRVTEELDAGPVYMKKPVGLAGSAQEIFERVAEIIFKQMIPQILSEKPIPVDQQGEITVFKRRTPAESALTEDMTLKQVYDHIRMLDAEGYPNAYIDYGDFKLFFSKAKLEGNKIFATVQIVAEEKKNE